jgi:hypothetical protein
MMRPCCFPTTITVVLGVTAYLQVALFVVSAEASTRAHAFKGSNGSIHSMIAEQERTFIDDAGDDLRRSFSDESEKIRSPNRSVSDTDERYVRVKVGIVEMNHSRVKSMVIAADSIELLRSHSNIE